MSAPSNYTVLQHHHQSLQSERVPEKVLSVLGSGDGRGERNTVKFTKIVKMRQVVVFGEFSVTTTKIVKYYRGDIVHYSLVVLNTVRDARGATRVACGFFAGHK